MSPQSLGGALNRAEPDSEHHCSPVLRSDVVAAGKAEGAGAVRPVRAARPALPCHNSNSCIEKKGFLEVIWAGPGWAQEPAGAVFPQSEPEIHHAVLAAHPGQSHSPDPAQAGGVHAAF